MKIRDLIDLLEQYAHDSDQCDETVVSIELHVREWTANCKTCNVSIDDVVISYAEPDSVELQVVLNKDDMKLLKTMNNQMKLEGY